MATGKSMIATVSFRPITDEDQPLLERIYASTREDELRMVPWSEAEKEAFLRQQFHAQHTFYQERFAGAEYLIVLVEGEPAGRLYVDRREDEIRIIDIALLPEFRGRGIGGSLLEDLLDEAASVAKPVRIHVERYNRALGLYERLGFRRIGDTGVYYLLEWLPEARSEQVEEPTADTEP